MDALETSEDLLVVGGVGWIWIALVVAIAIYNRDFSPEDFDV